MAALSCFNPTMSAVNGSDSREENMFKMRKNFWFYFILLVCIINVIKCSSSAKMVNYQGQRYNPKTKLPQILWDNVTEYYNVATYIEDIYKDKNYIKNRHAQSLIEAFQNKGYLHFARLVLLASKDETLDYINYRDCSLKHTKQKALSKAAKSGADAVIFSYSYHATKLTGLIDYYGIHGRAREQVYLVVDLFLLPR